MATTTSAQSQSQQQQQQTSSSNATPQQQLLVLVVEGTAALGPSWPALKTEYIDKIIRSLFPPEGNSQAELALVVVGSHEQYSGSLLNRSGWTSNMEVFNHWLSTISFSGGGFGEVAAAEGLAEALVMCCPVTPPPATQPIHRHCLFIAASNPYKLQTPVPHPCLSIGGDSQPDRWWLADAETVAKAFPQCHVSLSVICPRQLPSLRTIFDAARKNNRAVDGSATDAVKYSHHLTLISESFPEARNSLRRPTPAAVTNTSAPPPAALPPTVKVEQQQPPSAPSAPAAPIPLNQPSPAPAPAPAASNTSSVASAVASAPGRQPQLISNGSIPVSNVKIEHGATTGTLPSMAMMPAAVPLPLQSSAATPVPTLNQELPRPPLSSDTTMTQDFKTIPPPQNPMQAHRPVAAANVLNAYSQMRHNTSGPLSLGVNSSAMSNILSAGGVLGNTQGMATGMTHPAISHGLVSEPGSTALTGVPVNPPTGSSNNNNNNNMMAVGVPSQAGGMMSSLPSSTVGLGQSMQVANGAGAQGVQQMPQQMPQPGLGVSHLQVQVPGSGVNTNPGSMMQMSQPGQNAAAAPHLASTPPQQNAKYTRLWQGTLAGQRQGKPVPICNLEGYRQISSPETLAADWPQTMQIVRLISQDFMSSREYQSKAELLVFRPMAHHGFLTQLAEKKLCAVIQLPSQTLLLASADKPQRMIGMLFPGDMVVFKPQPSSSQQPQPGGGGGFSSGSFSQAGQLPGQQNKQMMPGFP